jgi:glycosyltransferase involved in cell wall biosynthesis
MVFRMAREPVLHQWFAPGEPPVIIGVGRLVKQKDYATLVRAFAKVRRRRPARLVILGRTDKREPNVQAELDALAESLGIAADFSILGFAENPYSYMARSAVLVSSSIYEGFGMVLAEALAVGTPVVATDCPSGPAEVLDNGRFGTLVPVGDPTAMAAGILKTIESPVPKDVLCERGALFSQSRGTERHLAILNSLVASRTRVARVAVLNQA